jgi:hypothetical protein
MLLAAALYWVLINVMRVGFEWLDRTLNRHLIADEQRLRRPAAASGQTLLARWTSLPASGTEQVR